MHQISSEERQRIETQISTAINVVNNLVDFNLEIHINCEETYSELTFSKEKSKYRLPILYSSPFVNNEIGGIIAEVNNNKNSEISGVLVIKFYGETCTVQNATTYIATLDELWKYCSINEAGTYDVSIDIANEEYQAHIFDVSQLNQLFLNLAHLDRTLLTSKTKDTKIMKIVPSEMDIKPVQAVVTSKKEVISSETVEFGKKVALDQTVKTEKKASIVPKETPERKVNTVIYETEEKFVKAIKPIKESNSVGATTTLIEEPKVDKNDQEGIHSLILDLFS